MWFDIKYYKLKKSASKPLPLEIAFYIYNRLINDGLQKSEAEGGRKENHKPRQRSIILTNKLDLWEQKKRTILPFRKHHLGWEPRGKKRRSKNTFRFVEKEQVWRSDEEIKLKFQRDLWGSVEGTDKDIIKRNKRGSGNPSGYIRTYSLNRRMERNTSKQ